MAKSPGPCEQELASVNVELLARRDNPRVTHTICPVCARSLKAPEVSLLALLEVIFGILLAWLGAGEAPGAEVLIGGTLVIGALFVNELLGWRSRSGTPRVQTLDARTARDRRGA